MNTGGIAPELIGPHNLSSWVPGRSMISPSRERHGPVQLSGFQYEPLEVDLPPLRDFMLISYKRPAVISRCLDNRWQTEKLDTGECSLMTCRSPSKWSWNTGLENTLVHLTREFLLETASEAFSQKVSNVRFVNHLRIHDPILEQFVGLLEQEYASSLVGGQIFINGIGRSLSVHLLRNYSEVSFADPIITGHLTPLQVRRVMDYVDDHLSSLHSLDELSSLIGTSSGHFQRQFRKTLGVPPYAYVMRRRLERATELIRRNIPLKEIAPSCGFCDQAHMTRVFRRHLKTTPKTLWRQFDRAKNSSRPVTDPI